MPCKPSPRHLEAPWEEGFKGLGSRGLGFRFQGLGFRVKAGYIEVTLTLNPKPLKP